MRLVVSLTLLSAASLASVPAFAQNTGGTPPGGPEQIDPDKNTVTVGIGGLYIPDYEGSDHHIASAAPVVIGSVDGFNFSLVGNRASVDLIPDGKGPTWDFQAGPVVALDLNRSAKSLIDDARVRALGKRDASIEAGGFVGIGKTGVFTSPYDKLSLSVSYRKGFTGAQRGGILTPTVNYLTPISHKAAIGFLVSADRVERDYGRAYFDVSAAGSLASGLPQFRTRGGWKSWTAGGFATYALTGNLLHGVKLIAGGTYTQLLNDFADSPIVSIAGNKSQWLGAVGVGYTF